MTPYRPALANWLRSWKLSRLNWKNRALLRKKHKPRSRLSRIKFSKEAKAPMS